MKNALVALAIALGVAAPASAQEGRARALEERLMAPCCWTQTLDAHDSHEARALRDEIERRLASGETVAAVEADLVARYGERIRAVPHEGFLDPIGIAVLVVLAAGAVGVIVVGRRWSRREPPAIAPPEPVDPASELALDDRLEAELERLPDV